MEPSTPTDPRTTVSTMAKEAVKTPEVLGSRSPRAEQLPVSSTLLRHSGSSATSVIISTSHSPSSHQTSLRSPPKESTPHSGEREGENTTDAKQRVCGIQIHKFDIVYLIQLYCFSCRVKNVSILYIPESFKVSSFYFFNCTTIVIQTVREVSGWC